MINFVNNGLFCETKLSGEKKKEQLFGELMKKKTQVIFA